MALVSSSKTKNLPAPQRDPQTTLTSPLLTTLHGKPTTKLDNAVSANKVSMNTPASSSSSSGVDDTSSPRANRIIGPDGRHHTQGEAARLGLIIRTACESCRNRKLKCSGTLPRDGGCERCSSDSLTCIYSARAPIGRPKKRKSEDVNEAPGPSSKALKRKSSVKQESLSSLADIRQESICSKSSESSTPESVSDRRENSSRTDTLEQTRLLNASVSGCTGPSLSGEMLSSWPGSSIANGLSLPSTDREDVTPALDPQQTDTKLPSLDDLSIAAFLQSLDTLEISPEELLRQQQHAALRQLPAALNGITQVTPGYLSATNALPPVTSLEEWASSSAILQPGLSFAVPADFSWWDLGIGVDPTDSGNPSTVATPAFERPGPLATSSTLYADRPIASAYGPCGIGSDGPVPSQPELSPSSPSRKHLSIQNWPRGMTAGMGQGSIMQTEAASEGGLSWSTFAQQTTKIPSVSSSSDSFARQDLPNSPKPIHGDTKLPACCAAKASQTATGGAGEPCSVIAPSSSSSELERAPVQEQEHCCSDKYKTDALPSVTSVNDRKPITQREHPSKVHCVPNPSGKGCTCLCDMSVALLSVKQVLRETDPLKQSRSQPQQLSNAEQNTSFASNTIQLTLTASQAITAQCACSADCPTCQSDPSTEISASLLVSTALQIYARAVRILREGFASGGSHASGGYSSSSAASAFFGGLEVTIGSYIPSSSNAKKIALFAIKLELKDLRRALGKVSKLAQEFNTQTDASSDRSTDDHDRYKQMNPIDQLVIFKLYRQLTELLNTVEGLEDVA